MCHHCEKRTSARENPGRARCQERRDGEINGIRCLPQVLGHDSGAGRGTHEYSGLDLAKAVRRTRDSVARVVAKRVLSRKRKVAVHIVVKITVCGACSASSSTTDTLPILPFNFVAREYIGLIGPQDRDVARSACLAELIARSRSAKRDNGPLGGKASVDIVTGETIRGTKLGLQGFVW